MSQSIIQYTILIPTFNEAANINNCLERVVNAVTDAEILIIDGGSDNTQQLVNELGKVHANIKYIKNLNDRGKGHAIQTGIKAAKGLCIAQIDVDLQFRPEELSLLFNELENQRADLVVGSRFLPNSIRLPGSTPLLRTLGNHFFSYYVSILLGLKFTDVLSGIKAWRKEVTDSFNLVSDNYSYELELIIRAIKHGWKVVDYPITTDARQAGKSSVNVIKVGFELLTDTYKVWKDTKSLK